MKGEGKLQLDRVWSVDRPPISERNIPEVDDIGHWFHLNGIDFPELDNKEVSILIGSDVPEVHWTLEERRGGPKEPLAVRTFKGTSLKDQPLNGPDLTNSLVGVLLRFRQESIAMMSDVEQMFHQVLVDPKDQDAFRFLWWPKGDLKAKAEEFQMLVHLFGATSSPSCANFALRKTAEDNRKNFDLSVIEIFYVGDCLKSVATIERALHLVKELPRFLERRGFNLTKWVSNRREVTTAIPVEKRASVVDLDLEKSRIDRALGVHWDIDNDMFGYKVGKREAVDTRRKILSLVSSIYDPLGNAVPLLLPAKKILQDLCRKLIGWDEIIPPELSVNSEKWIDNLPGLEQLAIPRCLKPASLGRLSSIQLHYFADASEIGYGAVSYLRLVDVSGSIHCVFLLGKSRAAPLKLLTILLTFCSHSRS